MAGLPVPRLAAALAVATVCLASSAPLRAAGRILPATGSSVAPAELRIAETRAGDWSRLWVQLRLTGTGTVAVVYPVIAGTYLDPVPDAWFEALEAVTAPRVLPPIAAPYCGKSNTASPHMTGALEHQSTRPPTEIAVLSSIDELVTFASARGLELGMDDEEALAAHGARFVALTYDVPTGGSWTQAVRLAVPASAPPISLTLLDTPQGAVDVTAWFFGPGRARVVGATEHTPDAVDFAWKVAAGKSDYAERRRELLAGELGKAWLVEAAGSAPLYQWTVLDGKTAAIPPVVSEYLERALAQGSASGSLGECLGALWDARAAGQNGASLSQACPKGSLAVIAGGPSCSGSPAAGEFDAATLACGDADDLAQALSGLRADVAQLTRQRSVVAQASKDVSVALTSDAPLSPVLSAPETDVTGCSGGGGGSSGSGAGGGTGAYGGTSSGYPPPDHGYSGDGSYVDDTHTDVHVSCSGSSDTSGDSCSGDSSDSSGDSCSGDSSDGSSDSCSGDSSDGSSDSCSGDSSSSGGDSCSGDSSSGGEGCSGDSSGSSSGCSGDSSGGGDCSVSQRRVRRLKLSPLVFLAAALLFPLRRFGRRRR